MSDIYYLYVCMDGCMHGLMDGLMHGWVHGMVWYVNSGQNLSNSSVCPQTMHMFKHV